MSGSGAGRLPQTSPPLRAVAWDIDGTLVDSEPLFRKALEHISAAYGVDISTLPEDAFTGVNLPGIWQLIKALGPQPFGKNAWLSDVIGYYLDHADGLCLMPKAFETVSALGAQGIAQAAVSNSPRIIVDANLRRSRLDGLMQFSISLEDVEHAKPDPAPYLMAAAKFQLRPEQVLAVEDSVSGVRSAAAAGMRVAGYGNSAAARPEADFHIDDLSQIARFFTPEALGSKLIQIINSAWSILFLTRRKEAGNIIIFKAFQHSQGQNRPRPKGLPRRARLQPNPARKGKKPYLARFYLYSDTPRQTETII